MNSVTVCCPDWFYAGPKKDWKAGLRVSFSEKYHRPKVKPDGSIILLSYRSCYCADPPSPMPYWLRVECGVTSEEWFELVMSITDYSIDILNLDKYIEVGHETTQSETS